jgi:type II secretion system protein C
MGQLGIRIVNVALLTVCSFQVASVFNEVSANFLQPGPSAYAATAAFPAPAPRDWAQRKAIIDRNVFGAQTLSDFQPEPEPEPEDIEATKLPVTLLGTQVHSVRENSKAAIAERGARDHELLWEGDELASHQGVRVVRIERGRVVLDNKGRREELLLDEASNVPLARTQPDRSSRRQSRRAAARTPSRTPTPITERLKELRDANSGVRNMGSILSQGRPVPKWENGELVGMELRDVEPGGLYEKVGLAEGDIITAVNGIELDNAADASKVLAELSTADSLEIETTDGTISVSAEDLPELLGGGTGE